MSSPQANIRLPEGASTVTVSVLSPNRVFNVPPDAFLDPNIAGTAYSDTPCFCFLIEHVASTGKKSRILFDLGIRKDLENSSPGVIDILNKWGTQVETMRDPGDILSASSYPLDSIETIIWSHCHFDHIGDITRFPSNTALVVGPGCLQELVPGWPINPTSPIPDGDLEGRQVTEAKFEQSGLRIAGLSAIDWFQDGSFYLLETPGHATGHMSVLARTTSAPDTFVLLGGDTCHHVGELRPTAQLPIPSQVDLSHHPSLGLCPGHLFRQVHPRQADNEPFYEPSDGIFNHDKQKMLETLKGIQQLDASPDIFTIVAHDNSLLGLIDLFPSSVNHWQQRGWKTAGLWRFLSDFDFLATQCYVTAGADSTDVSRMEMIQIAAPF